MEASSVFYKFTSVVSATHFPSAKLPSNCAETIKVAISFEGSTNGMIISCTNDTVKADDSKFEEGYPEDSDCNIHINQELIDISKNGIDKDKINILKTPTVEYRLMLLLNALDSIFYYAMGVKYVPSTIRAA